MSLFGRSFFLLLLIGFFIFPQLAHAAPGPDCSSQTYGNIACIKTYLGNVINGLLAFSGIAAVILICFSGIRLVLSGGDPAKIEKAKKSLTFAIVGFVIILLSYVIVNGISFITGAKLL
jgi:hypothetical protein